MNNSNQITNAYACGLKDVTTPFCIEGTVDGSKYNDNVTLLQSTSLWNGACTDNTTSLSCTGSVSVLAATSSGLVRVGPVSTTNCEVLMDGRMRCPFAPLLPSGPGNDTPF